MEPNAYNVLVKVHRILAADKNLDTEQQSYITGLIEGLLDVYREPEEDQPERKRRGLF